MRQKFRPSPYTLPSGSSADLHDEARSAELYGWVDGWGGTELKSPCIFLIVGGAAARTNATEVSTKSLHTPFGVQRRFTRRGAKRRVVRMGWDGMGWDGV